MDLAMGNTFYFDFEVAFMQLLQSIFGGFALSVISFFSYFGEEMVLVLVMGFIYWGYDKKMGNYVGTSILLGCVLNPLLKNIFVRRRPYFDNPQIKCLRPVEKNADIYDIAAQGFSFPSGHSTNSVSAYSSMAKYKKNKVLLGIAIVMPLLVGLSRMTVGVHYPTDVLCGWLSGLVVIFLVSFLQNKIPEEKEWLLNLIIFLIAALGFFYCKTDDYYSSLGLLGGFFLSREFDKLVVHFRNSKKPVRIIVRVIAGAALFLALTKILKMPFSSEFLSSPTLAAYCVRFLRYLISCFVAVGVYPLIFAKLDKFWKEEA